MGSVRNENAAITGLLTAMLCLTTWATAPVMGAPPAQPPEPTQVMAQLTQSEGSPISPAPTETEAAKLGRIQLFADFVHDDEARTNRRGRRFAVIDPRFLIR